MHTDIDFPPTSPDGLENRPSLPVTLSQALQSIETQKSQPVITLAAAMQQLGIMNHRELDMIWREDPSLLLSRSSDLVRRLLVTAEDLNRALARTAGIVEVDAARFDLPPQSFDALTLRVLRSNDLLYLGEGNESLLVASWCPLNLALHEQLCALTGRSVYLVWADRDAIAERLEHLGALPGTGAGLTFAGFNDGGLQARSPSGFPQADKLHSASASTASTTSADEQDIQSLLAEAVHDLSIGVEPDDQADASPNSSMVRMVRRIIKDAQAMRASDIHIETNPGDEFTLVRMRCDGDLEVYQKMPPRLRAPLISRIKVMARLDITEHRRPQDGKINFAEFGGGPLELRVAIMPTHDGMEDVVLRLLASSHPLPLSALGLQLHDADAVARMTKRSFGLILAVGPTGSGKTLHSMLAEMNTEERKIWTAEDPIEITQPGLRQVQVNPKIGLTFASAMRGFLRADPDVIMIGEIRDQETARIAIEASLTGHLVLSTLHTNSASESVTRLLDLGMDALNFADSLVGIVAQRLVRSLCRQCAEEGCLTHAEFEALVLEYTAGSPFDEAEGCQRLLAAAGVASFEQVRVKKPVGCKACDAKGYRGRLGIYEILENSPAMRLLIQRNARPAEIHAQALQAGMHSLRHDALEKFVMGKIDLLQARMAFL